MYQILKPNFGYDKFMYLNNLTCKINNKIYETSFIKPHCPVETSIKIKV